MIGFFVFVLDVVCCLFEYLELLGILVFKFLVVGRVLDVGIFGDGDFGFVLFLVLWLGLLFLFKGEIVLGLGFFLLLFILWFLFCFCVFFWWCLESVCLIVCDG